jgi:choline dehydrogenase-like flavoprotein
MQCMMADIMGCSGLKSSQLLELSGIGNRTILERYNIPVHIDLPSVGENVQGALGAIILSRG